jgi:hypothetical protein
MGLEKIKFLGILRREIKFYFFLPKMTKNTIIEILSFSIVVCLSLMSSEN